jgi:RNA polymerase sigma-70 factor (ECF subfamily)
MEEHLLRGATDHDLVEKAKSGDGKAFGKIVERHTGIVYAAARSVLGNSSDIDDTVQEVFIRIYLGLHSFTGRSALSTWIWSVARNHAINTLAKRREDHIPLESAPEIASRMRGPDEELARRTAAEDIEHLLSGLDEEYRQVVELRYLAGKKYREIAQLLEMPEGTVKTMIHRARIKMKKMIEERDSTKGNGNEAINGL